MKKQMYVACVHVLAGKPAGVHIKPTPEKEGTVLCSVCENGVRRRGVFPDVDDLRHVCAACVEPVHMVQ